MIDPFLLDKALIAVTTLFATVGPIDVAAIFAGLTAGTPAAARRAIALKGVLTAALILLFFALAGNLVLERLGITLAALQTAGGLLLFLIAIDMVFARPSGAATTTSDEEHEAERKDDISVFPLATPLIAGPGTMGAVMLLAADAETYPGGALLVIGAICAVMALTFALLMVAGPLTRLLGVTGLKVITRVIGVLLAALAVQFVFDGIRGSGILA